MNIMNPVIDYITHVKYGLDDLYTTEGILIGPKDVEIAESINGLIVIGSEVYGKEVSLASNIAARLGFETNALDLPIIKLDSDELESNNKDVIIVGKNNKLINQLVSSEKINLNGLSPGQGIIEIIPSGIKDNTAIVIAGSDYEGTKAASELVSMRLPFLWEPNKITIKKIKESIKEFFLAKNNAGEVARAISLIRRLNKKDILNQRIRLELEITKNENKLNEYLEKIVSEELQTNSTKVNIKEGNKPQIKIIVEKENYSNEEILNETIDSLGVLRITPDKIIVENGFEGIKEIRTTLIMNSHLHLKLAKEMVNELLLMKEFGLYHNYLIWERISKLAINILSCSASQEGLFDSVEINVNNNSQIQISKEETSIELGNTNNNPLNLSEIYNENNLLQDVDLDLVVDNTNTNLVFGENELAKTCFSAANIASRLGLESTGLTLPIAITDNKIDNYSSLDNPIIIGKENKLFKELISRNQIEKLELEKGQGVLQIIKKAFGKSDALIIWSEDQEGMKAVSEGLSKHIPYIQRSSNKSNKSSLSSNNKEICEIEKSVKESLNANNTIGQLALAKNIIDETIEEVRTRNIEKFEVELDIKDKESNIENYLVETISNKIQTKNVSVSTNSMNSDKVIFSKTFNQSWEVDDFWKIFKEKIEPMVQNKLSEKIKIDLRVSEPKEVRTKVNNEIVKKLKSLGISDNNIDVNVISSYKQGFIWIQECVIPKLKNKDIKKINIKHQAFKPPNGEKWLDPEIKWRLTLYPIDDVFEKELGIDVDNVSIKEQNDLQNTFTVEAINSLGEVVYTESFNVKYDERWYLDAFPEQGKVHPETGWITAKIEQEIIVNERIRTDPEKIWETLQEIVLPKTVNHILEVSNNELNPEKEPYFKNLYLECYLSEPDERTGIREELFSTLEQLEEDLYFVSYENFDRLGLKKSNKNLRAPGGIWIRIYQRLEKESTFKATLIDFQSDKPKIRIGAKFNDGQTWERTSIINGIFDFNSLTRKIIYRNKSNNLDQVSVEINFNNRDIYEKSNSIVNNIVELNHVGINNEFNWEGIKELEIYSTYEELSNSHKMSINSKYEEKPIITPIADRYEPIDDRVITWDEYEEILPVINSYDGVDVWIAGKSIEGRNMYAIQNTFPNQSEIQSISKLITLRPTYIIGARVDAHESSATSASLKFVEYLQNNQDLLKKVNVVLIPSENPDGAVRHSIYQKEHPNWAHHGARWNSYGFDTLRDSFENPRFADTQALNEVWKRWKPDVIEECHGCPSHEWTQPFSGYGSRSYPNWQAPIRAGGITTTPEAMIVPMANTVFQEITEACYEVEGYKELSLLLMKRYNKYSGLEQYWGHPSYKGMTWRITSGGDHRGWRELQKKYPKISSLVFTYEVSDSTAQGEYMKLMVKAHFTPYVAVIKTLANTELKIEKKMVYSKGKMWLRLKRKRPIIE